MAKSGGTKHGSAPAPAKKAFGSKTEYAAPAKTKINPDSGKK